MSGTHLVTTDSPGLAGLRRVSGHRRVAGVCSGLSRSTGIDVQLVRIAMVVLALGGGVGVALYGCAWALLPLDDGSTFPLGRATPRAAGWSMHRRLQVTAIVCFVTWLLLSSWSPFAAVPVVVAGLLLLVHRQQRSAERRNRLGTGSAPALGPTPASRDFVVAAAAWQQRVAQVNQGLVTTPDGRGTVPAPHDVRPSAAVGSHVPPPDADGTPAPGAGGTSTPGARGIRAARPRDRRRRLAWGVAVAALAWALGSLAGSAPLHLTPLARSEVRLSVALAVVGAGLFVAGLRGLRPRLLVPLGVVLVVVLAADHTGLTSPRHQWLDVQTGSGTASDPLRFAGTRAVHALPSSGDVTVQCRAADLTLTTSDDVEVQVDYRLRAADLTISGDHLGGSMRGTARTAGTSTHVVHVDLDAAACHVEVRHA